MRPSLTLVFGCVSCVVTSRLSEEELALDWTHLLSSRWSLDCVGDCEGDSRATRWYRPSSTMKDDCVLTTTPLPSRPLLWRMGGREGGGKHLLCYSLNHLIATASRLLQQHPPFFLLIYYYFSLTLFYFPLFLTTSETPADQGDNQHKHSRLLPHFSATPSSFHLFSGT